MRLPTRSFAPAPVVLVAVAGLLAGCGTNTVQGGEVSKRISDGLQRQVGQRPEAVRCPDQIEAKAGEKARCTIVASDGSEIGLTVSMKDDQGKFDYAVDQRVTKPPTKKPER